MTQIRKNNMLRRNDRCVCGSGKKYKRCCSEAAPPGKQGYGRPVQYIDSGEEAIRWVIADYTGTKFFSDKDGKVLVFVSKADATSIALMPEFEDQQPGEINVAGVGPVKWIVLQEKLPFVEISDINVAMALVRERIAERTAAIEDAVVSETQPPQEPTADA